MKLDNATRTELQDLYHTMRDSKEVFNAACDAVAAKIGKKSSHIKKRIKLEVENKLERFIEENQMVLDL